MTSWDLFEVALAAPDVQRIEKLQSVLDRLSIEDEATRPEQLELRAVTLAVLAGDGCGGVEAAESAASEAAAAGVERGWLGYYLAEAARDLGLPRRVLEYLGWVPSEFFEQRDIRWRAVRCCELAALARLDLGDWPVVDSLVTRLCSEYVLYGDDHDLAPPLDLVEALLARPGHGREALRSLADSINLQTWLGADMATRVRNALATNN